mmetsp:Transcript_104044/g.184445  ORF Transcript_104044/g.184445 Transcript_104044/m.184445 type:complete len:144 (-) Transcript_104044:195-626(-)
MGCGNGRCCSGRVAAGRSGCLLMVSGGPPGLTRLRCGVAFTTAMFAGAPNTWSPLVPPRRNAGDEKPRCSAPDVTAPKAKLRWAGHFSGVSVRLTALPRMGEVVAWAADASLRRVGGDTDESLRRVGDGTDVSLRRAGDKTDA